MSGQTEVRSEHCLNCGDALDDESNWLTEDIKNSRFYCSKEQCQMLKPEVIKPKRGRRLGAGRGATKLTEEAIRSNRIVRLRDQLRIDRLKAWIKAFCTHKAKDEKIGKAMDMAREENKDPEIARKNTIEQTSEWDYDSEQVKTYIEQKLMPDRIMAGVLVEHAIQDDPTVGDQPSTWHIGFSECGFNEEFPLDEDGLPPLRYGIPRTATINATKKKADIILKGERLGIVSLPIKEERRNNRSENRLILCQKEKTYNKVEQRMKARHAGEYERMAALKKAMTRTLAQNQDILDAYLDLRNRL
jgi:hypothetical protein